MSEISHDHQHQPKPWADHAGGVALPSSYDGAGNRTSLTTPAGTTAYGYDAGNRLTQKVSGLAERGEAEGKRPDERLF